VGREYYDLRGTDPRFTGELLGAEGAPLDNNGFLTTRAWAQQYKNVRNALTLIRATENSKAGLTNEQKNGFLGYAKTIEAYNLLLVLNRHGACRGNVEDINNLGPILNYNDGLNTVSRLLDDANSNLASAGATFAFKLSSGFAGFDTPSGFSKFNRALAARVAMYQGNKQKMRSDLNASFMDLAGDLNAGAYHIFGLAGNDERNPLFVVPDVDAYVVQSSWTAEAEPGDTRVSSKSRPFDPTKITVPVALDGLSGTIQVSIFDEPTTPVAIIRNEELILMWAEANIGSDNPVAVAAIDRIRTSFGLAPYSGPTDDNALLTEVIRQRRYSLFGEGHYLIDMRRTGRLSQIPTDRVGDKVHEFFPVPLTEEP
jgi:hypothetical protein